MCRLNKDAFPQMTADGCATNRHMHGQANSSASAHAGRSDATPAEKRLWNCVRAGQLGGLQFRRQFPIGGLIVDFCCRARRLVIELDRSQHADAARE